MKIPLVTETLSKAPMPIWPGFGLPSQRPNYHTKFSTPIKAFTEKSE